MGFAAFTTYIASVLYSHSTLSVTLILSATGFFTILIYLIGLKPVKRRADSQRPA